MSKRQHGSYVRRPPAVHPPSVDEPPRNQILAALPADDLRRVLPHLTTVPVRAGQVLHRSGESLRFVYFPNGGVASITTVLLDGTMLSAVTVGDEGVLGAEAMLSVDAAAPGDTLMQVPGTNAERMSVDAFRDAVREPGVFRDLVGRYLYVLIAQLVQTAACHAQHDAQQRCAHWLLMTHHRMHEQDFSLSHERLAVMLGMQRPTVSVVAARLQKLGLIRYTHGHVTVLDREGLEAAACECYPIVRAHFDRLRP
jgi:CRP-like cAMP-binding protein